MKAPLPLELLREPGEARLLRRTFLLVGVLYLFFVGITFSFFLFWLGIAFLTVQVLKSRYHSEAVEAGPDQFPAVHQMVIACATLLEVEPPRVYVTPEPGAWPIYTLPLPEPAVILHANWVKMLTEDEMAFFFLHELAHGKLGHRRYMNPVVVLENVGPISWLLTTPLEIMRYTLRPWMRLADFSADRIALAALDGDLPVVARAFAKVAAGEELAHRVNADAFLDQARRLPESWALILHEVCCGRLGPGRRLARLARFAGSPELPACLLPAPRTARPGILARLLPRTLLPARFAPSPPESRRAVTAS